jgi:iron complex transport system substrate-binding protein
VLKPYLMLLPNAREARRRVRAYFEERDDPLISAIGWVTEAIGLVGGEDIFARQSAMASKERQIESAADPQIISRLRVANRQPGQIAGRDGWHRLSAIRAGERHALNSDEILQPGP